MAELGAVASVVQLADVSLRMSGEICKFLDAYKHADRDAKSLKDALSEVEANVRSLRKYIMDFRKSKNAIDEYENLSETIVGALKGYDADILAAKQLLPSKPMENLTVKIRWASNKNRKIEEVMQRISRRNSNLTTALATLGRQHNLRIREDTQNILAKQATSDALALKSLAAIESNIQKQEKNHAEFISHSKTIIQANRIQQTRSNQQSRNMISLTSQQAMRTNRRLKHIEESTLRTAYNTKQAQNAFQRTSDQLQQNIDSLATKLEGIHTKTEFLASSVDAIPRIVHEEIRTTLTLIVDQALDRAEIRREREMQRLRNFNDTITRDIGSDINPQRSCEMSTSDYMTCEYSGDFPSNQDNRKSWPEQCSSNIMQPQATTEDITGFHYSVNNYKRRWSHRCSFGTLEVEVTRIHKRINGSPQSKSYVTVQIHLLPNLGFLGLPGLSISCSTTPTPKGYYQLAPMVSVYPIIDLKHPVYLVIKSGDLATVQNMLATREIHLRTRSYEGQTLLHIAAGNGRLDICQFLHAQGLSWYEMEIGRDYNAFDELFQHTFAWCDEAKTRQKMLEFLDSTNFTVNQEIQRNIGYVAILRHYIIGMRSVHTEIYQELGKRWPSSWQDSMIGNFEMLFSLHSPSVLWDLNLLLENGLNPNAICNSNKNPLEMAILRLKHCNNSTEETSTTPTVQLVPPQLPEESFSWNGLTQAEVSIPLIALFVFWGADLYFIKPCDFDNAEDWFDLTTHCVRAYLEGVFYEWRLALEWTESDPDQVFLEDERQRKQAIKLRGATRSGVDESVLAPPSIDGLRCRRCRRRYCNNHDFSIFKKRNYRLESAIFNIREPKIPD